MHNSFFVLVRSTPLAACQRQPWVRLQSVWTVLTVNPFSYKAVRIHAVNPPILLFFCLSSLQAPFHPMLCKLPDIHSTQRDVTAPWGWKILLFTLCQLHFHERRDRLVLFTIHCVDAAGILLHDWQLEEVRQHVAYKTGATQCQITSASWRDPGAGMPLSSTHSSNIF